MIANVKAQVEQEQKERIVEQRRAEQLDEAEREHRRAQAKQASTIEQERRMSPGKPDALVLEEAKNLAAAVICGGTSKTQVGDKQREITAFIKPFVEKYLKKDFSKFECVDAMVQVVAGRMHYLKIDAGAEVIFSKVMEPLPCNLQPGQDPFMLQGVQG